MGIEGIKLFGMHISKGKHVPLKVAAIYIFVGGGWILFSDRLLLWLVQDPQLITRVQTLKGWFFVLASSLLIAWLVHRNIESLRREEKMLRQELTERKIIGEALRSQFNEISTIFDSLNAVVYVADLESNELLYLNKYGMEVFREDWHGTSCCDILHTGRTGPCDSCPSTQLLSDGVPQSPCIWESHSHLTGKWHQCIDKAVRWTDGRWVRLEIAVDITEMKVLEKMKMELVSVLTHEIRTPLTAMMGYTELLLAKEVDAFQQKSFLSTIQDEAERLNELIDDFLDLQRVEATLVGHEHLPISVAKLLSDAAMLFGCSTDRHMIHLECAADIPCVAGDEGQLQRALKNLISNALKYSPEGGKIIIGARHEDGNVVIWVRDEGIGIPPDAIDRVFDKFYRVNTPAHRMIRGTGLGLSLVRETMEAHGGTVWVESRPGHGSTFFLSLPACVS